MPGRLLLTTLTSAVPAPRIEPPLYKRTEQLTRKLPRFSAKQVLPNY
jgi:hypothetical protein